MNDMKEKVIKAIQKEIDWIDDKAIEPAAQAAITTVIDGLIEEAEREPMKDYGKIKWLKTIRSRYE